MFGNKAILSNFRQARFWRPMKIITPKIKTFLWFGSLLNFLNFVTRGPSNDVISGTVKLFEKKLPSYLHFPGLIYLNILILIIGYQFQHVSAGFKCFRILIKAGSNESEPPQLRQYFTFIHLFSVIWQISFFSSL